MTASKRRAAGEREFCSCSVCDYSAHVDLRALATLSFQLPRVDREGVAAPLRAIVAQALLTGWGEP